MAPVKFVRSMFTSWRGAQNMGARLRPVAMEASTGVPSSVRSSGHNISGHGWRDTLEGGSLTWPINLQSSGGVQSPSVSAPFPDHLRAISRRIIGRFSKLFAMIFAPLFPIGYIRRAGVRCARMPGRRVGALRIHDFRRTLSFPPPTQAFGDRNDREPAPAWFQQRAHQSES